MAVPAYVALAAPQRLDPALFAPKAGWSYALPAKPPAPIATPTRDQMIEDVAYLQHAIEEAWAWSSRSTIESFRALPGYLQETPLAAKDAKGLCDGLAMALRNTGIKLELGGRCGQPAQPFVAVGDLDQVPANRNYLWRIERTPDHEVGILTISTFAEPKDPGWGGFAQALKALATTELLIVDLQHARGDDPRAGFALLAALGLEDYSRTYLRPPMFRDGAIAKTARDNARAMKASAAPARSPTLWQSFAGDADIVRIAREVVPGIERKTRAGALRVFVGPDCGRACQLVVRLARWQGLDISGTFEDASGDELGVIRLPHSGIIATIPTASYGPYVMGPLEHCDWPAGYAKTLLAGLHAMGHRRAEMLAWRTRPLPSCASLPIDRARFERKVSGCLPRPLPKGVGMSLSMSVDAVTAKRFLATCTGLSVGLAMDLGYAGRSTVVVTGSIEVISQALAAPFEVHGEWGCEPKLR
jgi:hypothetical protein